MKSNEFKVLTVCVCGSRDFSDKKYLFEKVDEVIDKLKEEVVIIEGGSKGADALAVEYANERKIPYCEFKADWDNLGKAAGPIRNKYMAEECDVVIAFKRKDRDNKGTNNMINQARKLYKQVYVFEK